MLTTADCRTRPVPELQPPLPVNTDPLVEPGIGSLVELLNGMPGVRTLASCEGHALRDRPPYVYFVAPVETATLIARRLRADAASLPYQGAVEWQLTGGFNGTFELAFSLRSPVLDRRAYSLATALWPFGLRRSVLDRELHRLTLLVQEAVGAR